MKLSEINLNPNKQESVSAAHFSAGIAGFENDRAITATRIPIRFLHVSPDNTYGYTEEEIDELMESVASIGVLDYPIVEMISTDRYEILSGQKRFLAMKKLEETDSVRFAEIFPDGMVPCRVVNIRTFNFGDAGTPDIPVDMKRRFIIAAANQQHEKDVHDYMLMAEQMIPVYRELRKHKAVTGTKPSEFVAQYMGVQARAAQRVVNAYNRLPERVWAALKSNTSLKNIKTLEEIYLLPDDRIDDLDALLAAEPDADLNDFLHGKQAAVPANAVPVKRLTRSGVREMFLSDRFRNAAERIPEGVELSEKDSDRLRQIGEKIEKLTAEIEKITGKYGSDNKDQ